MFKTTLKRNQKWTPIKALMLFAISFPVMAQFSLNDARYIGHVPKLGAGFEGEVIFTNYASIPKTVYLLGIQNGSTELGDLVDIKVEGNRIRKIGLTEVFDNGVSHFYIFGSRQITVALKLQASAAGGGSQTLLPETEHRGKRFLVFPSIDTGSEGAWEGLAILNFNVIDLPQVPNTQVSLALKSTDGTVLDTQTYSLGPAEKTTMVLSKAFPETATMDRGDYYFEITGDNHIGVTYLKGNTQSNDITAAFPVVPLELDGVKVGLENAQNSQPFTMMSAFLDGDVLNLRILTEQSCPWELSIYRPDADPVITLQGAQIVLQPGLTTSSFACAGPPQTIDKEFDLSGLRNVFGAFPFNGAIELVIQDHQGGTYTTLLWIAQLGSKADR